MPKRASRIDVLAERVRYTTGNLLVENVAQSHCCCRPQAPGSPAAKAMISLVLAVPRRTRSCAAPIVSSTRMSPLSSRIVSDGRDDVVVRQRSPPGSVGCEGRAARTPLAKRGDGRIVAKGITPLLHTPGRSTGCAMRHRRAPLSGALAHRTQKRVAAVRPRERAGAVLVCRSAP